MLKSPRRRTPSRGRYVGPCGSPLRAPRSPTTVFRPTLSDRQDRAWPVASRFPIGKCPRTLPAPLGVPWLPSTSATGGSGIFQWYPWDLASAGLLGTPGTGKDMDPRGPSPLRQVGRWMPALLTALRPCFLP